MDISIELKHYYRYLKEIGLYNMYKTLSTLPYVPNTKNIPLISNIPQYWFEVRLYCSYITYLFLLKQTNLTYVNEYINFIKERLHYYKDAGFMYFLTRENYRFFHARKEIQKMEKTISVFYASFRHTYNIESLTQKINKK